MAFSVPYEYYASQSGLVPRYAYTLDQHMFNYFATRSGLPLPTYAYNLRDHAIAFYKRYSGLVPEDAYTLSQHMFAYFSSLSGLTPAAKYTVREHANAVFNGGATANLFTATFGSTF